MLCVIKHYSSGKEQKLLICLLDCAMYTVWAYKCTRERPNNNSNNKGANMSHATSTKRQPLFIFTSPPYSFRYPLLSFAHAAKAKAWGYSLSTLPM